MKLVRTKTDDEGQLAQFFQDMPMPGAATLSMNRQEDFFRPYKMQSDDYETLTLLSDAGEVEAMASLIFREGVIEGKRQTIGYATDLRVSPSRRAILSWSQQFLPILEEEKQKRNCQYIFSVVAQSQRQAYNAFIRPRSQRRKLPRYHLFRRFRVVNLHGLWPFAPEPLSSLVTRSATPEDLDALAEYIVKKKSEGPLSFTPTKNDFLHLLERWQGLSLSDFVLTLDRNGKILGCVAPWSANHLHQVRVTDMSPRGQTLQDTLKVLSFLRLARPLANGPERQLRFRYLTHLFADNPDIFYSLLRHVWDQTPTGEFLAYPHFEGHLLSLPPRPFLSSSIHAALYCILSPNDALPDFLRPVTFGAPPDFELPFL